MNQLSFRSAAALLVAQFTLLLAGTTTAQTDRVPTIVPCSNPSGSGQPTLKRRQPSPDAPQPESVDGAMATVEKRDCGPAGDNDSPSNEKTVALKFEGLINVNESDLRKSLHDQHVRFPQDPISERDLVVEAANSIKQYLVTSGYRYAIVDARAEHLNDKTWTLIFSVNEGPQPPIAEFRFEGNSVFPSQVLAEQARQCMVGFQRDFYDADVFDYCLRRLDYFAYRQGYLQARFHDPKVIDTEAGVVISLKVEEGVLYRLGEIKIEGSRFISPDQIRAMLSLKKGDAADGSRISEWAYEALKKVYGESGYIQYTAEITPRFRFTSDKSEGIADFEINIDEGRPFKLLKISFKSEPELSQKELRSLLLIHEGDPYNQALFDDSIRKLNDTGQFEPIDQVKDADFRTNEEAGLLEVVIKLTKRKS